MGQAMDNDPERISGAGWPRTAWLLLLFAGELVTVAVLYQFLARIECQQTGWDESCLQVRGLVARGFAVLATVGLFGWLWPFWMGDFLATARAWRPGRGTVLLHLAGLFLIALPALVTAGGDLSPHFALALPVWGAGALAAALGGLLWLAPARAWRQLLSLRNGAVLAGLVAAAFLPDLAQAARPLWGTTALTRTTFAAVEALLRLTGGEVYADPDLLRIGVNSALGGIVVEIGQPCSGVEGFALVTAFVGAYGYLMRADLRFPRYWLVVLPLGLLASWVLNVVRITALVLIGAHVSPDLAVTGFHSYAGWLLFTLLAIAVIAAVQATPALHLRGAVPSPTMPFRSDPVAAQIVPFIGLMLAGIAAPALLARPDLGHPVMVIALAGVLWVFAPALRRLPWGWDWPSAVLGLAVGIGWIAFADPRSPGPVLDDLDGAAFALWAVLRLAGTVAVVPVIEELFFRGYLLARLDGPGLPRRLLALAISAGAFALLHDRWLAALLAGLVFGVVMLRRGRVTDAVLAHVVANGLVGLVALVQRDWSLI